MVEKTWRDIRITLPIDLADRLKAAAKRERKPVSELLAWLIGQYVEQSERKAAKQTQKDDPEGIR